MISTQTALQDPPIGSEPGLRDFREQCQGQVSDAERERSLLLLSPSRGHGGRRLPPLLQSTGSSWPSASACRWRTVGQTGAS